MDKDKAHSFFKSKYVKVWFFLKTCLSGRSLQPTHPVPGRPTPESARTGLGLWMAQPRPPGPALCLYEAVLDACWGSDQRKDTRRWAHGFSSQLRLIPAAPPARGLRAFQSASHQALTEGAGGGR